MSTRHCGAARLHAGLLSVAPGGAGTGGSRSTAPCLRGGFFGRSLRISSMRWRMRFSDLLPLEVPQRLKPGFQWACYGTTKVVPFPQAVPFPADLFVVSVPPWWGFRAEVSDLFHAFANAVLLPPAGRSASAAKAGSLMGALRHD